MPIVTKVERHAEEYEYCEIFDKHGVIDHRWLSYTDKVAMIRSSSSKDFYGLGEFKEEVFCTVRTHSLFISPIDTNILEGIGVEVPGNLEEITHIHEAYIRALVKDHRANVVDEPPALLDCGISDLYF